MSDWKSEAACYGTVSPEAFFPPGRRDSQIRRRAVEAVAALCQTCGVRRECAKLALRADAVCGVFAGVDLGDSAYGKDLDDAREELGRIVAEARR